MGAKEQIALAALKALVPVLRQAVNDTLPDVPPVPGRPKTEGEIKAEKIDHGLGILEAILDAI